MRDKFNGGGSHSLHNVGHKESQFTYLQNNRMMWYMYGAVVILVVYLVVLYLPQIIRGVKEKKSARESSEDSTEV